MLGYLDGRQSFKSSLSAKISVSARRAGVPARAGPPGPAANGLQEARRLMNRFEFQNGPRGRRPRARRSAPRAAPASHVAQVSSLQSRQPCRLFRRVETNLDSAGRVARATSNSPVDILSIAHPDHQDMQNPIRDLVDRAIVPSRSNVNAVELLFCVQSFDARRTGIVLEMEQLL